MNYELEIEKNGKKIASETGETSFEDLLEKCDSIVRKMK